MPLTTEETEDYSLKDSRPLLIFNKDSLHIESRVGRYPNTMIKKNKSIFPFDKSIAYTLNNKNQVVCSYAADHSIYVYDSISLINKFTCESKFIDYLPEFIDNKEVTNAKKMNDRFNQLPSYFGIYYDKYRNVYYRPVKHENKTKNKFGSQNVNEFKYSIMSDLSYEESKKVV